MSDAPTDEEMHGWHRQYAADDLLIPPPPDYLRAFGEWYAAQAVEQAVAAERDRLLKLRPRNEWHEDDGSVLWFSLPIEEPPVFIGTPLDSDWPEYGDQEYTHWQPLHMPPNYDEIIAELPEADNG